MSDYYTFSLIVEACPPRGPATSQHRYDATCVSQSMNCTLSVEDTQRCRVVPRWEVVSGACCSA